MSVMKDIRTNRCKEMMKKVQNEEVGSGRLSCVLSVK